MYAESCEIVADLVGLGSCFRHIFTGEPAVVKSDNEVEATRSSSEPPQESAHTVVEPGSGMSKHDCCAH